LCSRKLVFENKVVFSGEIADDDMRSVQSEAQCHYQTISISMSVMSSLKVNILFPDKKTTTIGAVSSSFEKWDAPFANTNQK
jgi:hypothetical protein